MYMSFIKSLPNNAGICCTENMAWWITCFSRCFWRPGKANAGISDSGTFRLGRGTGTKNRRRHGQGEHFRELTVLKGNEFLCFLLSSRTGRTCITFCRIWPALVPALQMLLIYKKHIFTSKAAVLWTWIHNSRFLPGILKKKKALKYEFQIRTNKK